MSPTADWIAVDWGTTRLRAWAMSRSGSVLAEAASDAGMGSLTREGFEPALLALVEPWLGSDETLIIACGMVGARQGWAEAPYATAPCAALPAGFARATTTDPRLSVHIIPGVKQTRIPDVMRGEETQIAGFLALNAGWDGIVCLPGTHTKWVEVSAGEIVSFQTYMTGEVFSLLSDRSVLRHSIAPEGWDDPGFEDALSDAMSRPEALAARLFTLRAADLLEGQAPEVARAKLSGLLIGAELAAARPYWLGRQVAVIGAAGLAEVYTKALALQGVPAIQADGARMTRAGLEAAYARL
ncbi:MAG: 2-dehydro-3-deoxygalactonokinase [Shimia sp.]